LRFEELPEIPERWIDFLNSKLPFLPAACQMQTLFERANAVRTWPRREKELFNRLANAAAPGFERGMDGIRNGSVAVVLDLQSCLFGGPVSQILKCLTAIRVCEELGKIGIPAVPIGCVNGANHSAYSRWSINLLDSESEIHNVRLKRSETAGLSIHDPIPSDQVEELLSRIEELGHGSFNRETMEIIRSAFVSSASLSSATANLMAELMKEWGMLFLDAAAEDIKPVFNEAANLVRSSIDNQHDFLPRLCLAMPVVACIVDPYDIYAYEQAMPVFDEIGLPRPAAWPQSSATVLDARSRRILNRFKLDPTQLFAGEEEIANGIEKSLPHLSTGKFKDLESEVEALMDEIDSLDPAASELIKAAASCREKVVYQLRKVHESCAAAGNNKKQVMRRQIHTLCNFLAPNGCLQERELGGVQIPLRYSKTGIRVLYEKLDIMKSEHQLISMD
jgi:uncharacterized protein YllA (UPF0747 family)